MSTRPRRPNAGNRLSSLLAEQTPLNDEDAELFAERDDDEDFDLEAEEREREREAAAVVASASSGDERVGSGVDDESEDESEHDDSNFSDSTDDSELENDVEPADAGEKELEKEQRLRTREQRIAERNKMFTIKRREPKSEDASAERRKKRVFTSADVLREGRHSSRKSALRNKQHLIEHMREVEERRARYVPPKRHNAPKLTQEQRLEEAKKTEAKNLASLNKFVELEEERKLQQRLAMMSKRPRLTQFVRFHSAQYREEPKLVEVVTADTMINERAEPEELGGGPLQDERSRDIKKEEILDSGGTAEQPASTTATEGLAPPGDKASTQESVVPHSSSTQEIDTQHMKNVDEKPAAHDGELSSAGPTDAGCLESAAGGPQQAEEPNAGAASAATEISLATVKAEDDIPPKVEEDEKAIQDMPFTKYVEGPAQLKTFNFLTMHDFPDGSMNRFAVRGIVLGRIASLPAHIPLKRMCPFSGQPAKYLDPITGVAYRDLETNKLLKLAGENKLGWSKELGGVFTAGVGEPRHASGVPEGFS